MATEQELYGQVLGVAAERRGKAARRGVEQVRRGAAGAMGQTSQQILAGTPVEFQPEMQQKERLQLQAMIADMMLGISKVEQLREQEVSVSHREMSNTLAQLARTQADLVGKIYQTRGGQRTAQINSASVRFAEEMKRIEKIRDTAGYHGKYTAGDRNDMRQQIQEDFSAYVKAKENPNTGKTQLVIIEEDLAFGRTSTRMGETFEWAKGSGGGHQMREIGKKFEEVFVGLPERDRALFVAEFPNAFNGLSVEDFLLPEASLHGTRVTDKEAMQEQRAKLKEYGIEAGALYSIFDKSIADLGELFAADEAANEMAERHTDALLSTMGMVGVPQELMDSFKEIMQTAEDVARGNIGKKQWAGPPPQEASAQEKTAWLQKEAGPSWMVAEDGTIGQVSPGGEFFAADDGTGQPLNFSAIAPAPTGEGKITEREVTGGAGDFTEDAASYLQTMWDELQQGAKGGLLEEFMKEPAFLKWGEERGYIDEHSNESQKRWAARQLIQEARLHQKGLRKDREHQRDLNIVSGKALARPGQKRRAGNRVSRYRNAIARKLGRLADPGTGAAEVMGEGIGGDGGSTSVAPGPSVTEEGAASVGTPAEAPSTPAPVAEVTGPREVKGGGGYSYRQNPDGSIEITEAPEDKGVGTTLTEGTAFDAITAEIGEYPVAEAPAAPEEEEEWDETDVQAAAAGMFEPDFETVGPGVEDWGGRVDPGSAEGIEDMDPLTATERGEGRRAPGLESAPSEFHGGAADVVAARGELLSPQVQEVLEGALEDGIINQAQYTMLLDEKDPSDLAEAIWITAQKIGKQPSDKYAEVLKKHTEFRPPTLAVEDVTGPQSWDVGGRYKAEDVSLSKRDELSLQKEANRRAVYDQMVAEREVYPWVEGELSPMGELPLTEEEKAEIAPADLRRPGQRRREGRRLRRHEKRREGGRKRDQAIRSAAEIRGGKDQAKREAEERAQIQKLIGEKKSPGPKKSPGQERREDRRRRKNQAKEDAEERKRLQARIKPPGTY